MSEQNNTEDRLDEKPLDKNSSTNNEKNITIKKSTYNIMLKGIVAAIALATFFGGYSLGTISDSGSDTTNEELMARILEMDKKLAAVPTPVQQPTQPSAPIITKISLDDDPVKGDPNAPVTIVEFSDFQCPFCKRFFDQTLPDIEEQYIKTGKVNFVYRDFPLSSIHPNAQAAHIGAECADEQGKFWEYHDILFEKQSEWSKTSLSDLNNVLEQFASEVGLESNSFGTCLESTTFLSEVNKDYSDGISYGVTGTPAFFIGNDKDGYVKLTGAQPFSAFQASIDRHLES